MKLPSKSSWHIIKGTWFVYKDQQHTVHIQFKNSGMEYIYVNEELVVEKRALKLRSKHSFRLEQDQFEVRTFPNNKALTSFTTELVINEELKRIFTFSYRTDLKRFLPLIVSIFVVTIPMVLMKLPSWSYYVMVAILVALQLLIFNKSMFHLEEKDHGVKMDI
jgi:hypothetical protein